VSVSLEFAELIICFWFWPDITVHVPAFGNVAVFAVAMVKVATSSEKVSV